MRALLYAAYVAAPWALLSGSPGPATTTIAASLLVALLLAVTTATGRAPLSAGTTTPAGSAATTRATPPRLPQHDADAAGHPRPRAPGPSRAVPAA